MTEVKLGYTNDFSMKIEDVVIEKKISYFDAVLWYCEQHNIEIEVAAKLLNSKIVSTIEGEANSLNMMKTKTGSLPI